MPIEGRVIRIFDEYTVAINVGSQHGVEQGMEFGIFTPVEPIIDPETDAELGRIRNRKAIVEVSTVFELFSICRTPTRYRTVRPAFPGLGGQSEAIRDPLPVNRLEIKPYPGGSDVHVGDPVEQHERTPD
jgi:hypothetical protein